MIEAIHDFLREHGFTQVETPMLQTLAGGAASRPFVTHHNALDVDVYLRISVELYLNRCIVGGLENIYDLGRAFRNEGISHRHSPEFTILEWMMSYADYWDVAKFTEDMAESVALRTLGTTKVEQYDGRVVDLATPWRRITLREAIADAVGNRLPGGLARAAARGGGRRGGAIRTRPGRSWWTRSTSSTSNRRCTSPRTSSTSPSTCSRSASATPRIPGSPSTSTR